MSPAWLEPVSPLLGGLSGWSFHPVPCPAALDRGWLRQDCHWGQEAPGSWLTGRQCREEDRPWGGLSGHSEFFGRAEGPWGPQEKQASS